MPSYGLDRYNNLYFGRVFFLGTNKKDAVRNDRIFYGFCYKRGCLLHCRKIVVCLSVLNDVFCPESVFDKNNTYYNLEYFNHKTAEIYHGYIYVGILREKIGEWNSKAKHINAVKYKCY